ncbi:MAG: glycosyltransferase family 4 protein [Candidatus Omnitrophica bacterium]|nr:glycosyltransferase family 4 protein [Candidatus Omnitrophota bacterium]
MKQKKIRILRIVGRLNIGGPAIQAITLTTRLNNAFFESKLIVGSVSEGEGDMSFLAKEFGVEPIFVPEISREINFIKDIIATWKAFNTIRDFKPHILHTHTAKAGFVGRVGAIFARVPIRVHTFHGHVLSEYFGCFRSFLFVCIEIMLACFTDRIIAISAKQKSDLTSRFKITSKEKCTVVPLGINIGKYLKLDNGNNVLAKKELGYREEELIIAIIGRLTKIKNHKLFLDMAKSLLGKSREKLRFAIIGDGKLKEELVKYVNRLDIADRVRFFGWRRDMERIYSAVDIIGLTSFNEGTPVVIIEAMASAKPVVSTSVGGVSDLVKEGYNGYLVNRFDVNLFSDKMNILIEDKDKRLSMGLNGREFVKGRYDESTLVNNIIKLYKELLDKKGIKI